MQKELKITIPEGYEIDQEKSTFEKIIFKKANKYPKSWDNFLKNNPNANGEYFITTDSKIHQLDVITHSRNDIDQNLCKTKEEAEAFLALIQLKRLWHEYTDGFDGVNFNYSIQLVDYIVYDWVVDEIDECNLFSFPSIELAQEFLNNFKELFKKVEPLFLHYS